MFLQSFLLVLATRIVNLAFFSVELLKSSFVKSLTDVTHHLIIEVEIMNDTKSHCKLLSRFEKMTNVGTAVITAGLTVT